MKAILLDHHPHDSRCDIAKDQVAVQTLASRMGTGGGNVPLIMVEKGKIKTICIEGNGSRPSHRGDGYKESDVMYTLNATECHAVAYTLKMRGGVSVDSKGRSAGKGALIQKDLSATLGTSQDQVLFQPIYTVDQGGGKSSVMISENISPTLTTTHDGAPAVCQPICVACHATPKIGEGGWHSH